ncbi:MAG: YlbF family regulator [Patescibacteria group bacterium]|jgi:cell fate (sporulation/competence/biofilm development) regulator YlbF (YheA/YmcA/DUF963 family)|nr:YlbF family regulator [Patescibacteria group bacterium]
MSNLQHKLKEFTESIRQTSEFQDYLEADKNFKSSEEAKKLLDDFQEAKGALVILKQGGFSGVEEQKEKTDKLFNEVKNSSIINNWLQSQEKVGGLISELGKALEEDTGFPFTPPPKRSCCG